MATLPSGAVAWWKFNNINGVLAPDSADGNDGIIVGATALVGGGLAFDGTDDFVNVPDSSAFDFGNGDFTIDFWANFAIAPGGSMGHPGDVFISQDEGAGSTSKWFLSAYSGFIDFHVNSPTLGPQFFAITPFNPTPGQWYNIALTRSGSQFTMYINGVAAGTATETFALPDVSAPVTIGESGEAFGGFFKGDLEQVAIYKRGLSSTEVQQVYAAGPTGGAPPIAPASFQLSTSNAGDTGPFTLSISSTEAVFETGATVTLSLAGQPSVVSTSTTVSATDTGLSAAFSLSGQADGSYTVTITNPDGTTYTVGSPLQLQPVSASHLWAQIIGPTGVRNGIPASYAIEYGNSGNVDATNADLLLLTNPGLNLTIHSATAALQYIGTDLTSSGSTSVQVSQLSGLNVAAGSVNVIPLTIQATAAGFEIGSAITPPTTLTDLQSIIAIYGSTTLDWTSLESSLQSPSIDSTDWNLIWTRFTNEVGTTTQSLITALSSAAATLNQIGEPTTVISSLVSYELEQASGILPNIILANTTDIADNGGGLDLSITRTYTASLLNRNNPGAFGYGWSFTYGITAVSDASGNVYINSPSGTELFTLQPNGTYAAQAGDSSILALVTGAYVLTNASGTVERFQSNGQLSSITDSNGNVVTVSYSHGVISGVTSSNGQTLTFATNAQGRIISATDGHGQTVTYTYNSTGNLLLSASGPDGTTSYTYDNSGNALSENALTQIVNPDGTTTNFAYNSQGYLSSESGTGGAAQIALSYPGTGTITATDSGGHAVTLVYDPNGNLGGTTDALGNTTRYQYNASGELTGVITPTGATYAFNYDADGNLTGYTDPDGGAVSASYMPGTDLLSSFTDQNGHTTDYSNNSAQDLTAITYDNGSGTTYQYSSSGLLTSSTDARGQTTTYTYNARGLLTRETFSDGTFQAYNYNALGELASAQATSGGVTTYGYNAAGDLTSVTNPSDQVESYTYNSGGQELTRTEPDGSVTQYSYNAAGQLVELQDGSGNLITQYSYNALGELTGSLDGNGQTTSYTYDADGNVTQILTQAADGTTTSRLDYTYNADGQAITATSLDGTWTYSYDASGQLTNAVFASINPSVADQNLTYVYDAAGNRTETIFNGAVNNYTTNGLNQYTASDGTTYDYDADGNLVSMTQSGATTTYTYNLQNQLTAENGPSGTYTYKYDALGNVVSSADNGVVTNYIIDPLAVSTSATGPLSAIAQAYNGAGNLTATYDYGNGLAAMINSSGTYYYNIDTTGNVSSLSGAGGNLVDTYNYTPFGTLLASASGIANPFQFSGSWGIATAANGLVDMNARYYDPAMGRFVSSDPIGIAGGENLYNYAFGNPISNSDPLGFTSQSQQALWNTISYRDAHFRIPGELSGGEYFYAIPGTASEAARNADHFAQGYYNSKPNDQFDVGGYITNQLVLVPGYSLQKLISIGLLGPDSPYVYTPPTWQELFSGWAGANAALFGVPVIASSDPNDLSGPQGVGATRLISDYASLFYDISFENRAAASAAAQSVVITDQLDPTKVNLSTFSLGPIMFGNEILTPPAASSSYTTVVDLRPANNLLVKVAAGLNTTTGLVTWTFTSLDPATGQPTTNPLAGFLPPDVTPPNGDGSVFFSVQPNSGLTTGTTITDSASIVFDNNAAIPTSQWANTIDTGPIAGDGSITEGHGQTVDLSSLINGLVTPSAAGDTETLTSVSASLGAPVLGSGNHVSYTAPASGPDTITYTVQDEVGNTGTGQVTITIDPGPTAGNGAVTEGHGKTANLTALISGLIAPGIHGDTETLQSVNAAHGSAVLGPASAVTYTAPAIGPDTVTYTVTDQYGDIATGQVAVTVDPGPTAGNDTVTEGHGKTVNLTALVTGLIAPGIVGDAETLTSVSATQGNAVLGSGNAVTYTAPASGNDAISYGVTDQYGDTATGQVAVTVDPGPTANNGTVTEVSGATVDLTALITGLVAPGILGDTETITSVSAATGTVVLGPGNTVTYTAPTVGPDTIGYTVSDQYGDTNSGQVAVTVAPQSQTFNLTNGADVVAGGAGANTINATTNTLSAGDQINGGGGGDRALYLTGAGIFNLSLPTTLTNVQFVNAQEGQAASPGFLATNQTITLRSGLNVTVNVAAAAINSSNPKVPTISIVGANDSSVINLARGNDVVIVGSQNETVNGGSGNDQIEVTAATIGAKINGGTGSSSLDVLGGGTNVAMGASITNISTVLLASTPSAMSFIANGISGLIVDDLSTGADTVSAGGLNQTLTGGAGKETFNGFSGGSTTFKDTAAAFNGDSINNFLASGDTIDITNLSISAAGFAFHPVQNGASVTLNITDGTHSAALTLNGSFNVANFLTGPDSGAGALISYQRAVG